MLFDTSTLVKRKSALLRVLPTIPTTGWVRPDNPPDLSNANTISIDVETYDPELLTRGPGWARHRGHLVGVSLAAQDRSGACTAWYFPLRHEVQADMNLPVDRVLAWLKTVLETPLVHKVGANITYDVGWLQEEGITVQGRLHDVQFAEALLDETAKTALDALAEKYLGKNKVTSVLYEWLQAAYGGSLKDQRGNIYKAPPSLVGPYAEADAYLPLQILPIQYKRMEYEDLIRVYDLECRLIPLIIKMRFAGITVDVDKAVQLYEDYGKRVVSLYDQIYDITNLRGSVSSNRDVAKMFDTVGIEYKQTEAGNPSITKDFLKLVDHPLAKLILSIREYEKLRGTFLKGSIIDGNVNGKLYPQLNQLRADSAEDGATGTITGRFSGDLQQIPSRTKEGKEIRSLFTYDKEHVFFGKVDASQVEYRFLAHYAVGKGSDELRAKYNYDRDTDYHEYTQTAIKTQTGIFIERTPIKNINFLLIYGGGTAKLAKTSGLSLDVAESFLTSHHKGAPYVKDTMKHIINETAKLGYVTTLLNRRIRFKLWEPADYGTRGYPLPYTEALDAYGSNIKLAGLYKAVNYKLQGSATGDTIKLGMLKCYEDGLFDVTGVPRNQIHDELIFSIINRSKHMSEAFDEVNHALETCVQLRVPLLWSWKYGDNWSNCK